MVLKVTVITVVSLGNIYGNFVSVRESWLVAEDVAEEEEEIEVEDAKIKTTRETRVITKLRGAVTTVDGTGIMTHTIKLILQVFVPRFHDQA